MSGVWAKPVPTIIGCHTDFEKHRIDIRFLQDIDLMHSCTETNTYVLDPSVIRGDNPHLPDNFRTVDLLWDLHQLNGAAQPFGQVVFLSYYSGGEFIIESATERWLPTKVTSAFEDWGYSDVKIIDDFVSVSEKDLFKLKLKFGC